MRPFALTVYSRKLVEEEYISRDSVTDCIKQKLCAAVRTQGFIDWNVSLVTLFYFIFSLSISMVLVQMLSFIN